MNEVLKVLGISVLLFLAICYVILVAMFMSAGIWYVGIPMFFPMIVIGVAFWRLDG